jgi:hypothetical protein
MRHRARAAHFRQQAVVCRGVALERLRQERQRDRLAEFQVVGAIDLAHAPAPGQRDDAVAAGEDGARREAARVDRMGRGRPRVRL